MPIQPVFRFAPSPNGHLHLGHAYSALLNERLARQAGGRLLLRIEDIDVTRCRPALSDAILEDLHWLGLSFEEPVRRQSEHAAGFRAALERLAGLGLLYPSLASRGEIAAAVAGLRAEGLEGGKAEVWEGGTGGGAEWPRDPDGAPLFPRAHLPGDDDPVRIAAGEPFALRLDMVKARAGTPCLAWEEAERGTIEARPEIWGDVVLARKEFPASYHLAVVVDDALQGVTDVVRGEDLFAATGLHRLLQHLLGLPAPRYRHHALVRGGSGEKLSKSLASTSLRQLRADGLTPQEVRRLVGMDDG